MRNFESYLDTKINMIKTKIIFIDLAYVDNARGHKQIVLGIKEKTGGFIGTNWESHDMNVEEDFTVDEFKETCEKFNVSCSVFCGE